ncbi:deoxynucleoside kinase [Folsomia candida]|uniref:Deoxynucleoside kinase n=1 Tax=Folsomia candida TaxID=158441 RepID=A0A226F7A0_FOLCA|nr:deoxynucleoside kinase [Folsomia candida]OXA65200.1 Deoxynucleoside kinase [Folsomia candida]
MLGRRILLRPCRMAIMMMGGGKKTMSTCRIPSSGGLALLPSNLTICVEGNIGSGKTTFLRHFKQFPEICVLDEPISKWRDVRGHNLLDLMYKNPSKWSLCFQSYVQLTMLDLHTKAVTQPFKMMERSIYSAKNCFVKNLHNEGLMEDAEYTVLTEWFDFARETMPMKVDLIVYLRTDPEVAYKRIVQRGRFEETAIKMDYLQSIHNLHEDWLINEKHNLPCPVLTLDANHDLSNMAPNYSLCEETIFSKRVATAVN